MYFKLFAYIALLIIPFLVSKSYALFSEVKVMSDISYGNSKKQVMDVYYPSVKRKDAPVIFMVRGGAWLIGDKVSNAVVKNKVVYWVPKRFVSISVNYRKLPEIRLFACPERKARQSCSV